MVIFSSLSTSVRRSFLSPRLSVICFPQKSQLKKQARWEAYEASKQTRKQQEKQKNKEKRRERVAEKNKEEQRLKEQGGKENDPHIEAHNTHSINPVRQQLSDSSVSHDKLAD